MAKPDAIAVPRPVTSGAGAIALFAPLLPACGMHERLIVAFLDADGYLLGCLRQNGDPGSVALPIRTIVGEGIRRRASGLLLAHNHPSGDPTPSKADVAVTRQLSAAAHPLGLTLHDHLVRAGAEWRSLLALDLL